MITVQLSVNGFFWRTADYAGIPHNVMVGISGGSKHDETMSADVIVHPATQGLCTADFVGDDIEVDPDKTYKLRRKTDATNNS